MAKTLIISIFFFLCFSSFATADNGNTNPSFSKTISPQSHLGLELGLHRQEKLTHFHFYFHDSINGKNPTAVRVAKAPTTDASISSFGLVSVMDDPLTVGPERESRQVGKAQGMYTVASQTEFGLLMVSNFLFTEGKFNGSSISIMGHNISTAKLREMPIVGGNGVFRFARGYALARPYSFNFTSLDVVVEYDVYVLHY